MNGLREGLLCFVAFLCIFLLTTSGHDNSEEGWYSYRVAIQIIDNHRISFVEPQSGVFNQAPDGLYYEAYGVGSTLLMLPLTWLNEGLHHKLVSTVGPDKARFVRRFLFASLSTVYSAAGIALIYLLLRIFLLQTRSLALTNVTLLGFCSYYWNYSRDMADSVVCCLLLCAATLLLFLYSRSRSRATLILAFSFLGFGLITRLTMVIAIGAAFLYLAAVLRSNWKDLGIAFIIAGVTLTPFLGWEMYYNHTRTGDALLSPLMAFYKADNGLTGDLSTHVPGLLISPGKGILVFAPPVLLSLFCFPWFFRRYRAEAFYVAAIGAGWLLFHAKLANNWFGAWGWGPRHFIVITPILAIPFLACGWQVFSSKAKIAFAAVCLAFGFVLAASAIIGDWLYRTGFAVSQGRGKESIWNLTGNQAADMIASSARNLARMFTNIPPDVLAGTSPMNQRTSNSVNIWWVTASHQGVPVFAIVIAVVFLAALVFVALRQLLHGESLALHEPAAKR